MCEVCDALTNAHGEVEELRQQLHAEQDARKAAEAEAAALRLIMEKRDREAYMRSVT
jgi:hypothetical protein